MLAQAGSFDLWRTCDCGRMANDADCGRMAHMSHQTLRPDSALSAHSLCYLLTICHDRPALNQATLLATHYYGVHLKHQEGLHF
jgi:hypothetical protein